MTKETLMEVILVFIGAMQASWSLLIPLNARRAGVPLAQELQQKTNVDLQPVISLYRDRIRFWTVVDIIALLILLGLVPVQFSAAYAGGCALTFAYGLFRSRSNPAARKDFGRMVGKACPPEDAQTVLNALNGSVG